MTVSVAWQAPTEPARLNPLVDEMMMSGCFAIYLSPEAFCQSTELLTTESLSVFLFWAVNLVFEMLSVFAVVKGFCVQLHPSTSTSISQLHEDLVAEHECTRSLVCFPTKRTCNIVRYLAVCLQFLSWRIRFATLRIYGQHEDVLLSLHELLLSLDSARTPMDSARAPIFSGAGEARKAINLWRALAIIR